MHAVGHAGILHFENLVVDKAFVAVFDAVHLESVIESVSYASAHASIHTAGVATACKHCKFLCFGIVFCHKITSLEYINFYLPFFDVLYSVRAKDVFQTRKQVGTNLNVLRKFHKF